ncbi:putative phage tail protein [Blautia glucerasea]|uniref:putative phage tail protein n=1 Tax=Blautia glucerasea TaxID=536633 RepID=UPI0015702E82|nr:putative phage tail protein [Blautia glucerasea]NSJ25849.1 DUF2313 domain-containing protein [Blautia glucerasea]
MEIFNNGQESYEEIVSSGPAWWTEYKEMDAVYRYEGWLLDLAIHLIEQTVKNQYPSQADEKAIAEYERILRVDTDVGASLEERRRTIAACYSGTGHLSKSVIQSLVKTYTGKGCEITWDGTAFQILIQDGGTDIAVVYDRLATIISKRMPVHINYNMVAEASIHLNENVGIYCVGIPNIIIH